MSDLKSGSVLLPQQLEAVERVRQAQQRARQTVARTNAQFEPPSAPVLEPLSDPPPGPAPASHRPGPPGGGMGGMGGMGGGMGGSPGGNGGAFGNGPGRPGGAPNILSQLFGGGLGGGRPGPSGPGRPGPSGPANGQPPPRGGLLDLFKGKGLGESVGSLGDTLHSTVSSVSEPIARLLDAFDIDGEKLIILLVMWVIFNERGDKTLLLALGYLLI